MLDVGALMAHLVEPRSTKQLKSQSPSVLQPGELAALFATEGLQSGNVLPRWLFTSVMVRALTGQSKHLASELMVAHLHCRGFPGFEVPAERARRPVLTRSASAPLLLAKVNQENYRLPANVPVSFTALASLPPPLKLLLKGRSKSSKEGIQIPQQLRDSLAK
jgi:acetylornithine deacetylase/succinyl-diaminopimelate desuccinylase-like protein